MAKKSEKSIPEKVDAHTHVSNDKFVLYPPFPDAIKIEITSRCNYSCSFCAHSKGLREIGDMDRNFLYRILWGLNLLELKRLVYFY